MARSFGIVEDKVQETEFFLEELRGMKSTDFRAKYYFSAFISAARTITLSLQATLSDVAGFKDWYETARTKLATDPLAEYFLEIRNNSVHQGLNPLNLVSSEHLREYLVASFRGKSQSHVIVMPGHAPGFSILSDANQACSEYFSTLLALIYDCYLHFLTIVDPQWYFTQDNFAKRGKGLREALDEIGLPADWETLIPNSDNESAWRALRRERPFCPLNPLFQRHLGKAIAPPD